MDKPEIREAMTRLREGLTPSTRKAAADKVAQRLLEMPLPHRVFAFVSVRDELPTRALLEQLRSRGHEVGIPRLTGRGTMNCVRFEGVLEPGPYGVPTCQGQVMEPDLVLTPGLAFDLRGGRVGYGGGYYDRWLTEHPAAVTLGLCFDFQVVDCVPTEANDVALDGLLTEVGVRFSGDRLDSLFVGGDPTP